MIEQKATVTHVEASVIWVETQRQSTCSQCQLKQGCGSGLLARHVGKRLSRIALPGKADLTVGQEITLAIPEHTLLRGALMLYLLPLLSLLMFTLMARTLGFGDGLEVLMGMVGLLSGFYGVRQLFNKRNPTMNIAIIEEST